MFGGRFPCTCSRQPIASFTLAHTPTCCCSVQLSPRRNPDALTVEQKLQSMAEKINKRMKSLTYAMLRPMAQGSNAAVRLAAGMQGVQAIKDMQCMFYLELYTTLADWEATVKSTVG